MGMFRGFLARLVNLLPRKWSIQLLRTLLKAHGRLRVMSWPLGVSLYGGEVLARLDDEFVEFMDKTRTSFGLENWSDCTLLDLGCADGRRTRALQAKGFKRTIAVDRSVSLLKIAERNLLSVEQRQTATVDIICLNVEDDDLPPADVVVLSHVLEHIEDRRGFLLRLGERCSFLIAEVPDREANLLEVFEKPLGLRVFTDPDHKVEFSKAELLSELGDSGWSVTDFEAYRGLLRVSASSRGVDGRS